MQYDLNLIFVQELQVLLGYIGTGTLWNGILLTRIKSNTIQIIQTGEANATWILKYSFSISWHKV
jgi:hypothetical protein